MGTHEMIFRLLLASVLGGLIGLEREANNRPAGLRTHILVSAGSALIMLVSIYGFVGHGPNGEGGEPARLAAQVVSGIGFLGAGTILRQGNSIKGLTTAASLWVSGGIGLAIGDGYYVGGLATAGIVLFSLTGLRLAEKHIFPNQYKRINIVSSERPGLIGDIGVLLGQNQITIKQIEISQLDGNDKKDLSVDLVVKVPHNFSMDRLFVNLSRIEGLWDISLKE